VCVCTCSSSWVTPACAMACVRAPLAPIVRPHPAPPPHPQSKYIKPVLQEEEPPVGVVDPEVLQASAKLKTILEKAKHE
jgi:hypothetical protein